MPKRSLSRLLPFCCLVLVLSATAALEEETVEGGKATLLFAILDNTSWPGEDQISEFVIGLYGRDKALLKVLNDKAPERKIRGKSIVITSFDSLSEARSAHVLVVARSHNTEIAAIDRALHQSHTLIVTDSSIDQNNIMINFTHPSRSRLAFEVNRSNIIYAGLQLSKRILLFGGTELDTATIYKETEAELVRAKAIANSQQQRLEVQQAQLAEQEEKIRLQSRQVATNEAELAKLEQQLGNIQATLVRSADLLRENEAALIEKETVLAEKEAYIEGYSAKIRQNLARLENQQVEITEQERLISEQNTVLKKQVTTIENQQFILTAAIVVLLVVSSLIVIIFRSYRSKHRINVQLAGKTRELEVANEKLTMVTEAKSRFLSTMSHEIRTPMNGVIGMAELLEGTELTAQQSEYLALIISSADTLLSLINDILDFSKIEAGKLELESIPFDLRDIVGDTLRTMALRANEKGLELTFHIPPAVPDRLLGDPIRLRQILVNLVGNAIKFTASGEIAVDVGLESMSDERARASFSVRDTGVGVTQGQRKKIFEAFGQADASTTREFGGTGLGLAIASQLAEMMGGDMTLMSEIGQGSTFSFSADFGLPDEPAILPLLPDDLRGQQVLVVDDNSTNRMILGELLANWGMVATIVDSGGDALAELERAESEGVGFALALLDVMMPGMDGYELAAKIRERPAQEKMRILMLTSAGHSDKEAQRRTLDISRALLKPVKHSDLLSAITQALSVTATQVKQAPLSAARPRDVPARRVLLVEDNLVNQKVAKDLLTRRGHSIEVAQNGAQGVEAVREGDFDVVLMDIHMPVMDGLAATRAIRELERATGGHIPITAMTAGATKEDRESCFAAGMDLYITKPFRADELYRVVEIEAFAIQSQDLVTGTVEVQSSGTDQSGQARTVEVDVVPAPLEAPARDLRAQAHSGTGEGESCLDWAGALEKLEGDAELLCELAQMYLDQCSGLMAEIGESMAKGDAVELRRTAHTLKGSASVVGGTAAAAAALLLENLGRDGKLEAAAAAFSALQEEVAELNPILQATVQNSTSASDPG